MLHTSLRVSGFFLDLIAVSKDLQISSVNNVLGTDCYEKFAECGCMLMLLL